MICCARHGSAAPSVLLRWSVAAAASNPPEVWRTAERRAGAWEAARPRRQPVARATRALEVRRVVRPPALPVQLDPAEVRDLQEREPVQRVVRGKVALDKAALDRVGAARATEAVRSSTAQSIAPWASI